jgi:hypothetical protein
VLIENKIYSDMDFRPGPVAGFFFNIFAAGDRLSLQPELLFAQKGYLTTDEASYFYIDGPVPGVVHLVRAGRLRFSVFAGARLEFWHLGLDARFNYGISTMSKNSSLRNLGFAETITYSFIDSK